MLVRYLMEEQLNKIMVPDQNIILEGTVTNNSKYNVSAIVEASIDRSYGMIAYFKYYNHQSHKKATKCARICFKIPRYQIHPNAGDGKQPWILSSSEKRDLIKVLNSKPSIKDKFQRPIRPTVWEELIYQYNEMMSTIDQALKSSRYNTSLDSDIIPLDYIMPDYMQLQPIGKDETFDLVDGELIIGRKSK